MTEQARVRQPATRRGGMMNPRNPFVRDARPQGQREPLAGLVTGFVVAVATLVLFGVLAEDVATHEAIVFDGQANTALHRFATPTLDVVMNTATLLGSSYVLGPLVLLVLIASRGESGLRPFLRWPQWAARCLMRCSNSPSNARVPVSPGQRLCTPTAFRVGIRCHRSSATSRSRSWFGVCLGASGGCLRWCSPRCSCSRLVSAACISACITSAMFSAGLLREPAG